MPLLSPNLWQRLSLVPNGSGFMAFRPEASFSDREVHVVQFMFKDTAMHALNVQSPPSLLLYSCSPNEKTWFLLSTLEGRAMQDGPSGRAFFTAFDQNQVWQIFNEQPGHGLFVFRSNGGGYCIKSIRVWNGQLLEVGTDQSFGFESDGAFYTVVTNWRAKASYESRLFGVFEPGTYMPFKWENLPC